MIGIILARLLSPEDFGIVGMLAIFIAIAQTFADSGLQSALIQKKDCTEADCSTIFYFNIVVAVACYLVLFVSAPWISDFYRMPVLTDVLRVSALSLIVISMSAVHNTRLTKELRFRDQSIISIVSMVFSGTTGLYLVVFGAWGVWALVFQTL
ncbi:lipopolysaccharide biosynthesis protein, partial [gut metagenome]